MAFFLSGCTGIAEIEMSSLLSLKRLQAGFMRGCTSLTSIKLPPNVLSGCTSLAGIDTSSLLSLKKLPTNFGNVFGAQTPPPHIMSGQGFGAGGQGFGASSKGFGAGVINGEFTANVSNKTISRCGPIVVISPHRIPVAD